MPSTALSSAVPKGAVLDADEFLVLENGLGQGTPIWSPSVVEFKFKASPLPRTLMSNQQAPEFLP